jgi:radical SAM family RiPP maturation amino acid epimerase
MAKTQTFKPSWQETEAELNAILASQPEEFQSLIEPLKAASIPYASEIAHLKRFVEMWRCNPAFRAAYAASRSPAFLQEYGIKVEAEAARYVLERSLTGKVDPESPGMPLVARRHRFFMREKLLHREKLRSVGCAPAEPRHKAWRERQIRRSVGHLGPLFSESIVHAPFAIEITDGCSVGCWFCGISAEKKKSDFLYTESNAALWRSVLATLRARMGESAASGFLYWASDPMDNPDYEKLALDFANICGRFPQTTTAIAHKDVERTRALLRLSSEHGCTINRFSVLSLGQFNKIMEAFTPEELLHCEIIGQHAESANIQSNAGRARNSTRLRERAESKGESAAQFAEGTGTIACVSGWLINMPRRSVRLITPCPASDRWPNGYWTLEEGHFETAADLEALMEAMTRRHMKSSIRAGDIPRFRADLEFQASDQGFVLRAAGCVTTFSGVGQTVFGKIIAEGCRTAAEIALQLEKEFELPMEDTFTNLNNLFDGGFLDEEPAFTQTVSAS